MFVVFRVVNSDYENKEIVALCSDFCIAEEVVSNLVANSSFCGNATYIIGSDEDM